MNISEGSFGYGEMAADVCRRKGISGLPRRNCHICVIIFELFNLTLMKVENKESKKQKRLMLLSCLSFNTFYSCDV